MEVKPVFMVLECNAVYPGTKKESIQRIWDFSNVFMNYMDIWAPKLETVIWKLHQKKKNEHDKFVAAIHHDKRVEGRDPKNLSKQFYQFLLLPSCSISCEVTGKWVSRGGFIWLSFIKEVWFYMTMFVYGLEIPVKYKFIGPQLDENPSKQKSEWYCDWALHVRLRKMYLAYYTCILYCRNVNLC